MRLITAALKLDFPKITVVTVCYNAAATIERCIRSVISQRYVNKEYIIIDGGSTDATLSIIDQYKHHISKLISAPDHGIYDAMNKGIHISSGEIVGTLNADDFLANENILTVVHETLSTNDAYIAYGDLDYINGTGKVIRKWRSGPYKKGLFNYGWMPPHPTLYCKRELFDRLGNYSLAYGSTADYELMARFIHANNIHPYYIPMIMVKMQVGGVSNSSLRNRLKAMRYDSKAMYANKVFFPAIALLMKLLRKIKQFF